MTSAAPRRLRCPYCQSPVVPSQDGVVCSACGIPHHRECWRINRGCTTYACKGYARRLDLSGRPGHRDTRRSTQDGPDVEPPPIVISLPETRTSSRPATGRPATTRSASPRSTSTRYASAGPAGARPAEPNHHRRRHRPPVLRAAQGALLRLNELHRSAPWAVPCLVAVTAWLLLAVLVYPHRPAPVAAPGSLTRVVVEPVYLREQPSDRSAKLTQLQRGQRVLLMGVESGDWVKVRPDDAQAGYVPRHALNTPTPDAGGPSPQPAPQNHKGHGS